MDRPSVRAALRMLRNVAYLLAACGLMIFWLATALLIFHRDEMHELGALAAQITQRAKSGEERVRILTEALHEHNTRAIRAPGVSDGEWVRPPAGGAGALLGSLPSLGPFVRTLFEPGPLSFRKPGAIQVHLQGSDCAGVSRLMVLLLHKLGVRARKLFFYDSRGFAIHTAVEAEVGGRSVILDPSLGTIYRLPDGRLATVDDLAQDPDAAVRVVGTEGDSVVLDFRRVRSHNWGKIPILMPLSYRLLRAAVGGQVDRLPRPLFLEMPKLLAAGSVALAGMPLFLPVALLRTRKIAAALLLSLAAGGVGLLYGFESLVGEAGKVSIVPAGRSDWLAGPLESGAGGGMNRAGGESRTLATPELACDIPPVPEILGIDRCDREECTLTISVGPIAGGGLECPWIQADAGLRAGRKVSRRQLFVQRAPCDALVAPHGSNPVAWPSWVEGDVPPPAALAGEFLPYHPQDRNLNGVADADESPFLPVLFTGDSAVRASVAIPRIAGARDCAFLAVSFVAHGEPAEPGDGRRAARLSGFAVNASPISLGEEPPPADQINSLTVRRQSGRVGIMWDTSAEFSIVGFRLIGASSGGRTTELSRGLIPARKRFTGEGASYLLNLDEDSLEGHVGVYVEVVTTGKIRRRYGPAPRP